MANTKSTFYATVSADVSFELQLDPDIYKTGVLTATGLSATKPSGVGAKIIPISIRYALRSRLVGYTKMKITKGTGEEKKTRSYQFLTEVANSDTAAAALVGQIIDVGNGSGVAWTIA